MVAAAANRAIGRARVSQIERVNARSSAAAHDLPAPGHSQAHGDLLAAYDIIEEQRAHIARLEEKLAQYERPTAQRAHSVDGRPVLTAAQAADQVGISIATVNRYVNTGFWAAAREPGSRRWLIYADQALRQKSKA